MRIKGIDSSADVVGIYYTPHTWDNDISYSIGNWGKSQDWLPLSLWETSNSET